MSNYDSLLAKACNQIKTPREKLKTKEEQAKLNYVLEKRALMAKALEVDVEELSRLVLFETEEAIEVNTCGVKEKLLKTKAVVTYSSNLTAKIKAGVCIGPMNLPGLTTLDIASIFLPEKGRLSSWRHEFDPYSGLNHITFTYYTPTKHI